MKLRCDLCARSHRRVSVVVWCHGCGLMAVRCGTGRLFAPCGGCGSTQIHVFPAKERAA